YIPVYSTPGTFTYTNGSTPIFGSVTLQSGVLYGMTSAGGTGSDGVIFQLGTPSAPICDMGMDTLSSPITCNGGTGGLSVSPFFGVSPYAYSWSTGATTSSISGQAAGSYTVTVT